MAVQIELKKVREKKRLSQNQLASKLAMTVQNIQRIEGGRAKSIPLDTLEKLCLVLECTPNDLIHFVPDNNQAKDKNVLTIAQ